MPESRVTFAKLRQFLFDSGFTETIVPDSHVVFSHARSETDIMLPIYKSNQIVQPRHVASVRVMMDAKGLFKSDVFDRLLTADSAKQSASG
jgi:hypothetical protein